jgi:hypothetical protein
MPLSRNDMETNPVPTPDGPNPATQGRFQWVLILTLLFGPAVLAFLGAMIHFDGLAVASPPIGGLVGGLYCGIRLAKRFSTSTYPRILIGLFFGTITACAIIGIGFGGCVLGNYRMDFR